MVALGSVGLALGCGNGEQGGKRRKAIRKPLCEPLAISEEMKKKELPNATTVYYLGKPVPIILFEEKEKGVELKGEVVHVNMIKGMDATTPISKRTRGFVDENCWEITEGVSYKAVMEVHLKALANYGVYGFEPVGEITCENQYALNIWRYKREEKNRYKLQKISVALSSIVKNEMEYKKGRCEGCLINFAFTGQKVEIANLTHIRRHRVYIRDEKALKAGLEGEKVVEVEEIERLSSPPTTSALDERSKYERLVLQLHPLKTSQCDEPVVYEWVEDLIVVHAEKKAYLIKVNEKGVSTKKLGQ